VQQYEAAMGGALWMGKGHGEGHGGGQLGTAEGIANDASAQRSEAGTGPEL
jgi:hypothetical protein